MTLCAACGEPFTPNTFAVPVVHIDENGIPDTGELEFAHRLCPAPFAGWSNMSGSSVWRLP